MRKTLKTLINTGLFMLFFSHSHGLALVYSLNDVYNPADSFDGSGNVLDNTTHPGFNGIDDTFDGSVIFKFTITFDVYISADARHSASFHLSSSNASGNVEPIIIGNVNFSDYWNGARYEDYLGASNPVQSPLNFGSNPVVVGQPQEFTLTIDYNAGALDAGTLIITGDPIAYDIGDFNYSFDRIYFIGGFSSGASATDMSVSIVPEPATYALLSGALALVFVAVRRRFKA